jgi:RNA polymerase sigma-70 factor (family 1)
MFFHSLYKKHQKKTIDIAAYIVNDHAVAEEISQECFFTLYEILNTKKLENPSGYLFQTVKNLAFDYLKHQKVVNKYASQHHVYEEWESASPSPEQIVGDEDYLRLIREVINELPAKCRSTFILNRFYEMSYSEIAQSTGISDSGVEKNMMRGLNHCRKYIPEFNTRKKAEVIHSAVRFSNKI